MASAPPPVPHVQMKSIGREGYFSWAAAPALTRTSAARATAIDLMATSLDRASLACPCGYNRPRDGRRAIVRRGGVSHEATRLPDDDGGGRRGGGCRRARVPPVRLRAEPDQDRVADRAPRRQREGPDPSRAR